MGNISWLRRIILQTDKPTNAIDISAKESFQKEKALLYSVDKIICLSNHAFDLLHKEYQVDAKKMSVISNGLSAIENGQLTIYNERIIDRIALRRKWRISEKEFIILSVGRLHPIKGLVYLINAFRKVLDNMPDCRLIIAGNGNFDTYLQETKDICTKTTFTGLLEKQDLYELYQIADVGVIPSLYEPFGYVAVEMMMHGLPIVATATSGLNEVIDDTSGLKIPVIKNPDKVEIDTELLSEKILYLLQNPEEAKKMGEEGRKRYLKHYSSKTFRSNMLNFYRLLTGCAENDKLN